MADIDVAAAHCIDEVAEGVLAPHVRIPRRLRVELDVEADDEGPTDGLEVGGRHLSEDLEGKVKREYHVVKLK